MDIQKLLATGPKLISKSDINSLELNGANENDKSCEDEHRGKDSEESKLPQQNEKHEADKGKEEANYSPRIHQYYGALGPVCLQIMLGMIVGFDFVSISQLYKINIINDYQTIECITSLTWLTVPVGCILSGWLMEIIGRKWVLKASLVPCMAGWLLAHFGEGAITPLVVGRLFSGLCTGLIGPASAVYVAETSDPKLRPVLLAILYSGFVLGVTLVHLIESFLAWRVNTIVSIVVAIFGVALLSRIPASPTFLSKKSLPEAVKAFYWFRGYDYNAELELKELLSRQSNSVPARKKSFFGGLADLGKPEFFKPLLIMAVISATNQWSGEQAVYYFSVEVEPEDYRDAYFHMHSRLLAVDVAKLLSSLFGCFLLTRFGRRALSLLSCVGMFLSVSTLTCLIYIYMSVNYVVISWAAIITFTVFANIGLMPMFFVMMGEIFPLENRGLSSGIAFLINETLIFSILKSMPWMYRHFGYGVIFPVFSVCSLIGTLLLWRFLPETKNRPLHWIEDYFRGLIPSNYF